MPNLKKFVALSLGAVCLLSSCNHTVNAEGAKKFIEANYGSTEKQTVDYASFNFVVSSPKNNKAQEFRKYAMAEMASACKITVEEDATSFNVEKLDTSSEFYKTETEKVASSKITTSFIDAYETIFAEIKHIYTTSGKELSIYVEGKTKLDFNDAYDFTASSLEIYNDHGMCRYLKQVASYEIEKDVTVKTTGIFTVYYK